MTPENGEATQERESCPPTEMQEVLKVVMTDAIVRNSAVVVHILDTSITSATVMYTYMGSRAVTFATSTEASSSSRDKSFIWYEVSWV